MFSPFISLLSSKARISRSLALGLVAITATQAYALSMPQRLFGVGSSHEYVCPRPTIVLPYLAQVGPTPLRFAPPPPEPVERPAPVEVKAAPAATAAPEPVSTTPSVSTPTAAPHEAPVAAGPKPVSILPDDTPHEVRAEDVLPYFQLPRQSDRHETSGVNMPFTPALPQSSATYQLK